MTALGQGSIKYYTKTCSFCYYLDTIVVQQDRRFWKVFTLITEVHADCFAGGKFKTSFRDPILHIVYTQLHTSLCMWEERCTYIKGKIVTNNDASGPFKTDFTILLNKNQRQGATLGNTHLLLIRIRQRGPSSHLKQSMGQKPINEGRQMASKIKVVKIRQYTVFPHGVVSFFKIKKNDNNMFSFGQKH